MRVPWTWLNEYTDLRWDPQEAAHRLTMAGINVEGLSYEKLEISSVVSAKVLDVKPHPRKPGQQIGILDAGTEKLQIVSGAPGFKKGNIALVVRPGGTLPGGVRIEPRELDGVVSQGMAVCANELLTGQPPRPHEDIILLPPGTALGIPAQELFELDDWVMELELTVNYSHCLGILGVAMEASALAKTPLVLPEVLEKWNWAGAYGSLEPESHNDGEPEIQINLPDPELCPRYVGKLVEDVRFAYSPVNIERRLYLAGQRPLNLIVDATNYVMLETGQPLHAFDAGKISGKAIAVRSSRPGEVLVTLDGEERELPERTIVIADASGPVAVAGIMGGKATEITGATRKVLVESAYFEPLLVRLASQKLKLRTEAALRFEKGVDPTAQAAAAERAAALIAGLSGGMPVSGYAETNHLQIEPKRIMLHMKTVERVLGTKFSPETCREILEAINFQVEEGGTTVPEGTSILVTVPPRRVDIQAEVDLIEEVARHYGYGNLGIGDLSRVVPGGITDPHKLCVEKIRDLLVSLGGMECVTNSLVGPGDLACLGWNSGDPRGNPVRLRNPLSSQESVLRTSLIPGLMKVASANMRSGIPGMFIWEIGRVFFPSAELPIEAGQIGFASYGVLKPETWLGGPDESGFYRMKGVISSLMDLLGAFNIEYLPRAGMPFHPGRSARIVANMSTIGEIGELHPVCLKHLDIPLPVTASWLSLDGLMSAVKPRDYKAVSRFMPVERDLAVIVPEGVPGGDVIDSIRKTGKHLVSVILFDIWRKPPVPPDHKSLAIRLVYQPQDRTLTEEELAEDRQRIMKRLKEDYDAVLRA
ncbi:MAG TPA: phenylalanine--tRNA ligase subunit beta [Firmicutes bacterium]|nr:phenylalanine--tRNA ligase subunit beta [Candidatus Fermentithermobacillaceae bacterium]